MPGILAYRGQVTQAPGQTNRVATIGDKQALGGGIDFRSDIYGLAVVAYYLVFGELTFTGTTSELIEFH